MSIDTKKSLIRCIQEWFEYKIGCCSNRKMQQYILSFFAEEQKWNSKKSMIPMDLKSIHMVTYMVEFVVCKWAFERSNVGDVVAIWKSSAMVVVCAANFVVFVVMAVAQ